MQQNAASNAAFAAKHSAALSPPARLAGWRLALLLTALTGLALGLVTSGIGRPSLANWIWGIAILPALLTLLVEIATNIRRGNIGLDLIAALAMIGALAFGQSLAGLVIALMYSGGQFLEEFAERRARREMTALLSRVPKSALRYSRGSLEEIPLEAVAPEDRILIRTGEAVPADGVVATGAAVLDQSAVTGESVPVDRREGERVFSGSINLGAPFDLSVERTPEQSTYAGIVRLVEAAQQAKAPMVRLADRYAIWFLVLTVAVTAVTWFMTADPVRALAVLVVATPCPLILAVPVALISGMSRIAKHGVLVKGGAALEALARVHTIVIDKTGTLTEGRAQLVAVVPLGEISADDLVRLAATLELASKHVVAVALVAAAESRGLKLSKPSDVVEAPGVGIEGSVDGRRVLVGAADYVRARLAAPSSATPEVIHHDGAFIVTVAIDGVVAGSLVLADEIRADVPRTLERLRSAGVARIVLASGDRLNIARHVGSQLDIDEIEGDLNPQDKVATVLRERKQGPVMMVGDGVNDAPALAAADIGVALGARGAAAAAETADVVLLVDRLDRLGDAIEIARRSRFIALQSATVGLGLSIAAMAFAAAGYLPPVQGALLQEVIDVAVVLNALRALGGGSVDLRQTAV